MKGKIVLLLACLLLIIGCSPKEEPKAAPKAETRVEATAEIKVVGKWQHANDKKFSCEFAGDHTGTMKWADASGKQLQAPVKWSQVKGENKVAVEADLGSGPTVGIFDFKDDKLVSPSGQDVYLRVK